MTISTVYKLAAEMSTRGNLPAGLKEANKQLQTMQGNIGDAMTRMSNLGRSIGGGTFAAVGAAGKGAAVAAGVAAAGTAAAVAKGGLKANAELERMTNTIGGTLQLFNHSAGAANQLGTNISVAKQAMKELNKIAVKSPGELEDVSKMFENMLPGARGVTGDMNRIMKLTQNLALFTPTLTGGDFLTSGSQMGRILAGSAGAEMDTWKKLQPVILKIGQDAKIFNKNMQADDKLTAAFNKLTGDKRMELIEKAFSKGGDDLANMYAQSWEGASAAALSGVKQVRNALTEPIYDKIKQWAQRHAGSPDSLLGENRVEKMIVTAKQVGALMAMPVERMLSKVASGMRYVQENAYTVVNKIYQGFQVAGAIIRGAAAFFLTRMMIGAGLIAGAAAGRAGAAAVKGVSGAYNMTSSGIQSVKRGAKAVRGFMDSFRGQSAISRALGFVTMLGKTGAVIAVIIPMLAIAAAAFALLSIPLLAAAGIAVYISSKWTGLSGSIVQGFKDGSITIRPLIVAALILWERLRKIGEAFIGGEKGASLMQRAINMAASVVSGLSEGIAVMAQVAAGLLKIIGKLANAYDDMFGDGPQFDQAKFDQRLVDLMNQGQTYIEASRQANHESANGAFDIRNNTMGDDAIALAVKLDAAAKSWKAVDISSISESAISSWSDIVTKKLADFFGKGDDKKTKKGPAVAIANLYMTVDLRGEDPDRSMSAFIRPLENMAKHPVQSTSDTVGGMGG